MGPWKSPLIAAGRALSTKPVNHFTQESSTSGWVKALSKVLLCPWAHKIQCIFPHLSVSYIAAIENIWIKAVIAKANHEFRSPGRSQPTPFVGSGKNKIIFDPRCEETYSMNAQIQLEPSQLAGLQLNFGTWRCKAFKSLSWREQLMGLGWNKQIFPLQQLNSTTWWRNPNLLWLLQRGFAKGCKNW